MGQAWCKERTTKAQDSKSPLDRVFVRCAHQIYPGLKEEGSVLGGATQRVTSSEIGYAGSPPREALARGQSLDSVDRPFHPSEWVDVNLEVPSSPRDSSVVTNLTANTNLTRDPSLCPTTTLSSGDSSSKDATPIPPPRRRRRNRGRPLPPKPDEVVETHKTARLIKNLKEEPLYSSVKSSKTKNPPESDKDIAEPLSIDANQSSLSSKPAEDSKNVVGHKGRNEGERSKEIHEHKMNGTGRVIPSIEVTHRNDSTDRTDVRQTPREPKGHHRMHDRDYDQFSRGSSIQNTSTPNKEDQHSKESRGNNLRLMITETTELQLDAQRLEVPQRTKNYSTVSLPNYDELEVVKSEVEREGKRDEEATAPKKPARSVSTASLPLETIMSSLPQETAERLENYVTRCRSFGSLLPHEILDKLKSHGEQVEDSSDEDDWGGLDDWDLGVVEHYEENDGRSPLEPSSRLRERKMSTPKFNIGGKNIVTTKKEDKQDDKEKALVNISENSNSTKEEMSKEVASESKESMEPLKLNLPRNASFNAPKSPNSLKSAMKHEAVRKISMPARLASENEDQSSPLEDWFSGQERSVRFFDSPEVEEEYSNTPGHRPARRHSAHFTETEFDTKSYVFNGPSIEPLHSDTFFVGDEDFGGTPSLIDSSGLEPVKRKFKRHSMILTRTLSNESEPFDGYEEKELAIDIQSQSSISKISRTISDESIPEDMLEDDFFDENMAMNAQNEMSKKSTCVDHNPTKNSKTPPPSPEPKIKAEILDIDHSSLLKVLKEERGEAESNLSSMTPSLTELEAALSDMLEKEDKDEDDGEDEKRNDSLQHSVSTKSMNKPIEPKIVPVEKEKSHPSGSPKNDIMNALGETTEKLKEVHRVLENSQMKTIKPDARSIDDEVEEIIDAGSQVVEEGTKRTSAVAENIKNDIKNDADHFAKVTEQSSVDIGSKMNEVRKDLSVNLAHILNDAVEGTKDLTDKTAESINDTTQKISNNLTHPKMVEIDLTDRETSMDSQGNEIDDRQVPGIPERKVATKIVDGIFNNHSNHSLKSDVEKRDISGYSVEENGDVKTRSNFLKMTAENFGTNPFEGPNPFDEPPEKPSRLYKVDLNEPGIPTPPQRRNRHSFGNKNTSDLDSSTEFPIKDSSPHPHDRLI